LVFTLLRTPANALFGDTKRYDSAQIGVKNNITFLSQLENVITLK